MTDKILDKMNGQEIKELVDNQKISVEELDAASLRKLMDHETDMLCLGDGDVELICKCSDRLDAIRENGITDESFFSALNKAKTDHTSETSSVSCTRAEPRRKRIILRRIGLTAAVIALLLATTVLVASAFDCDIFKYLNELARQPVGTEFDVGNHTFYNAGEHKKYASIEEMMQNENVDFVYPSDLPDDIVITEVRVGKISSDCDKTITILTNHKRLSIGVDIAPENRSGILNGDEVIKNGEMTFYIVCNDVAYGEPTYFANCLYKGNDYGIEADTYEHLILIIESLKEQ